MKVNNITIQTLWRLITEIYGPDALDLEIIRSQIPTTGTGGGGGGGGGGGQSKGFGITYLFISYQRDPGPNPFQCAGLTNSHVKTILWRETHDRIYKNGINGAPDYTYLDNCFTASNQYSKNVGLQLTTGIHAPPSFFDIPGVAYIVAGKDNDKSTVPWDNINFQPIWEAANTLLAARYKSQSRLKYVCIQGPGIASESFFAIKPDEQAQADALATQFGYSNRDDAWRAGTRWLIDMFVRVWSPIPVVLITGNPYGDDNGTADLQAMFDYGNQTYNTTNTKKFWGRADDLNSHGSAGSVFLTKGSSIYQMANSQNDPTRLDQALTFGTDLATGIEVFADDCDNPADAPALDAANVRMNA